MVCSPQLAAGDVEALAVRCKPLVTDQPVLALLREACSPPPAARLHLRAEGLCPALPPSHAFETAAQRRQRWSLPDAASSRAPDVPYLRHRTAEQSQACHLAFHPHLCTPDVALSPGGTAAAATSDLRNWAVAGCCSNADVFEIDFRVGVLPDAPGATDGPHSLLPGVGVVLLLTPLADAVGVGAVAHPPTAHLSSPQRDARLKGYCAQHTTYSPSGAPAAAACFARRLRLT